MSLDNRPWGVWLLAAWVAAHAVAGVLLGIDAHGAKATLVWVLVVVEVFVAAGLLLGWRVSRHLLIVQVAVNVFALATVTWVFVFMALAWGLQASEVPAVVAMAVYLLFVCWAFVYLLHPAVREHFRGTVNPPLG